MVILSRIYTRTGDRGTTALGNGRRVAKNHPRVMAYGTVDELNAVIGLSLACALEEETATLLRRVQNDLFDLGADLCVPEISERRRRGGKTASVLRLTAEHVKPLEKAIDGYNASLPTLKSFVLPSGTGSSAWLHFARTVCRRAERAAVTLAKREPVNPQVIAYLNRLSDLLFVLARRANAQHPQGDILWVPGGGRPRH